MTACTHVARQGGECTTAADCSPLDWCVCGQCGYWTCNVDADCPSCAGCVDGVCVEGARDDNGTNGGNGGGGNGDGGLSAGQKAALGLLAVGGVVYLSRGD